MITLIFKGLYVRVCDDPGGDVIELLEFGVNVTPVTSRDNKQQPVLSRMIVPTN